MNGPLWYSLVAFPIFKATTATATLFQTLFLDVEDQLGDDFLYSRFSHASSVTENGMTLLFERLDLAANTYTETVF